MAQSYNLGSFLKLEYVEKGFELLKKQIEENTHTFKTLELEIYRKEDYLNGFDIMNYYNVYIKKDVFYNYPNLFYNNSYTMPKSNLGVRSFNFTSFRLMILYYSLGFYLHNVISSSLIELEVIKKEKNINTYYGGKLNYDNPSASKIYYHNDYKSFLKGINNSATEIIKDNKKAIVIKMDIQDYFNNIDHLTLLKIIENYSIPSVKQNKSFNPESKDSILQLLNFIVEDKKGLPLSANNIISNYLSYIYLIELDDYVRKNILTKSNFKYFRYVDDFYIIYSVEKTKLNDEIGNINFKICTSVSDFLMHKLSLRINNLKSKINIIENEDQLIKFKSLSKFFSFPPDIEVQDEKLRNNFTKVIEVIERLKADFKTFGEASLDSEDDSLLKEMFLTSVKNDQMSNYVKSKEAIKQLDKAFLGWNFILTLNNIKSLMFFIGSSNKSFKKLEKYLKDNFKDIVKKTQYLYLLERVLLNEKYSNSLDTNFIANYVNCIPYYEILKRIVFPKIDKNENDLPFDDNLLNSLNSLTQQIKLMHLAEKMQNYNVAFNHLLNSLHYYCFHNFSTPKKLKNYDRNDLVKDIKQFLTLREISFVISFFDRRNKNSISHPGENELINWIVGKKEYYDYKTKLKVIIKKLNSS